MQTEINGKKVQITQARGMYYAIIEGVEGHCVARDEAGVRQAVENRLTTQNVFKSNRRKAK